MEPNIPAAEETATFASRFTLLSVKRESFLRRAREASRLTIPSLIPPEGHTGDTVLPSPWQSVGSRGVNHLASKLLLTLLPPNQPFFRYSLDPYVLDELVGGDDNKKSEIQTAFSRMETAIMSVVDSEGYRTSAFEAIKHLLVGGNALLYDDAKAPGFRVFHLSRYVCQRDAAGNPFEIIVKEEIPVEDVPEDYREHAQVHASKNKSETVELYTQILKDGTSWTATQEIAGMQLTASKDTYPEDRSPWLPMRWTRIDGETYGRGLIEEYIGDLNSLEGLSQLIVEATAITARTIYLVDPSGYTKPEDISKAKNGDAIRGREAEVGELGGSKPGDLQVSYSLLSALTERLSQAFLLHRVRDAERVTAEEVRFNANELESSLGGVYSILAQEFQLPLITRITARLEKEGNFPNLPKDVTPVITTGVDALGRFHELSKITSFAQTMTQFYGPEVVASMTKPDQMAQLVAASLGLDITSFIKTQEELDQERQQQQQQALLQSPAATEVVKGVVRSQEAQAQADAAPEA